MKHSSQILRHCERSAAIHASTRSSLSDMPPQTVTSSRGLPRRLRLLAGDGDCMRERQPTVYIMANKPNGTLYTGVTSDLIERVYEHRNSGNGFTSQYNCTLLVWYETHTEMPAAILREKQIKVGSRKKKLVLIKTFNPTWEDLYETIL